MREYIDEEAFIKDDNGFTIRIVRRSVRDADGNLHNSCLWKQENYWHDPETGAIYDYDPHSGTAKLIFWPQN